MSETETPCQACADAKVITFHCRTCGTHCDTIIPVTVEWCAMTEMCSPCIQADNERRHKMYHDQRAAWIATLIARLDSGENRSAILGDIYDNLHD